MCKSISDINTQLIANEQGNKCANKILVTRPEIILRDETRLFNVMRTSEAESEKENFQRDNLTVLETRDKQLDETTETLLLT